MESDKKRLLILTTFAILTVGNYIYLFLLIPDYITVQHLALTTLSASFLTGILIALLIRYFAFERMKQVPWYRKFFLYSFIVFTIVLLVFFQIAEYHSSNRYFYPDKASVYFAYAEDEFVKGNYSEASKLYKKSCEFDPKIFYRNSKNRLPKKYISKNINIGILDFTEDRFTFSEDSIIKNLLNVVKNEFLSGNFNDSALVAFKGLVITLGEIDSTNKKQKELNILMFWFYNSLYRLNYKHHEIDEKVQKLYSHFGFEYSGYSIYDT